MVEGLSAGQSLEHFAVNQALQSIENAQRPVCRRRLATVPQAQSQIR